MQSKFRARAAVAALAGATTLALAACSGGGTAAPSASSSTIDYSTPTILSMSIQVPDVPTNAFQLIAADYTKKHPKITFDIQQTPVADYGNVVSTQLQAGNGADIIYGASGSGNVQSVLTFASAGYLAKLPKDAWLTDRIPASAKNLFELKGDIYGFPLSAVVVGEVGNLGQYESLKLKQPTTFAELLSQCKSVAAKGKSLFTVSGSSLANAYLIPLQLAANDVYSSDPNWNSKRTAGSVTFASSKGWKLVFDQIGDMNKAGCFAKGTASAGRPDSVALVGTGSALQRPGTSSLVPELSTAYTTAKFGFVPMPAAKAADSRIMATPSNALAVNAKSKNQALAVDFLKFFATQVESEKYASTYGELPLSSLQTKEFPDAYSNVASQLKGDNTVLPLESLTWPNGNVANALGTGFQGILTGQATTDQVLQSIDAAWG